MIDINKKYQTRDGRPVRILCTDRGNVSFPVIVLVPNIRGEESVQCRESDGSYGSGVPNHPLDLIPAVVKTSKFQPVYTVPNVSAKGFDTLEDCRTSHWNGGGDYKFIGALELRYEDGVFVDVILHREVK